MAIADLPTSRWTHVETTGRVTRVAHEADGDWHLRLEDGRAFVIIETIPEIPLTQPMVGACVRVWGIARYDKGHRWQEVHPARQILEIPCVAG